MTTDRQNYLKKNITYKDYYACIGRYYGWEELEALVKEWLTPKVLVAQRKVNKYADRDSLYDDVDGWVNLVPMVDRARMDSAFAKAGGVMARGEVVCILKEVAKGIVWNATLIDSK